MSRSKDPEVIQTSTLVVGSGIAAMVCGLGLSDAILITPNTLGGTGSTRWAQGGIAAAIGSDDSFTTHIADTLRVSGGLANSAVANDIVSRGPKVIEILESYGVDFDYGGDGGLALGKEAGHTRRRIVKSNGDAIGKAVADSLASALITHGGTTVCEGHTAIELATDGDGTVIGALVQDNSRQGSGTRRVIQADTTVLATGGYGACYVKTTNPNNNLGSGLTMAHTVGATLKDLEYVQFHPTALDIDTPGRLPLLTEALRGDGALLVNNRGHRFAFDAHPDGELAPRDVVARAIYSQVVMGHRPCLDLRPIDNLRDRFPTVGKIITDAGLDPVSEPIPVTPAAHYTMGGVAASIDGTTNVVGLRVIGEAACTSFHGANRLASNSLLEAMVMGIECSKSITSEPKTSKVSTNNVTCDISEPSSSDGEAACVKLRNIMWEKVGVVRSVDSLREAIVQLGEMTDADPGSTVASTARLCRLVAEAALANSQSAGSHYIESSPGS